MKLKDLKLGPEALEALAQLIHERTTNLGIEIKLGHAPLAILIGEICTVEAKIDALMHLLEDKQNVSYKMYPVYVEQVCKSGIQNLLAAREAMVPKGPTLIKP